MLSSGEAGIIRGVQPNTVAVRNDEKIKHWRGLSSTIALRAALLLSMDFAAGCSALKKQSAVIERIDYQLMLRHTPLAIG